MIQTRKPLKIKGLRALVSQGPLFPLDWQTLSPRYFTHFRYAFRPFNPLIPSIPVRLWNFCSHFVATVLFTSKPLDTTQNEWRTTMDKYIFDESNGLWYELHGDYYLPCLTLPEEEYHIGIWGQRHKRYLKQEHHIIY